ncbi:hypothetical protein [Streptomyces albireticuli]|uniref:hypothetical protein n=1 Tax=Streptomyces albireticuli TaxID=1940 RepID=UPI0013315D8C|nr:hypothetical protein [Streptomyces albireticuli]
MAVVLVAAGPAALPAAAHSEERANAVLSCVGINSIAFSPGLTFLTKPTRITGRGDYRCASTDPSVTTAKSVIKGEGENSCLLSRSVTEEHITWNTGERSTVVYDVGIVPQPAGEAVVLVAGKVTSGRFAGRRVASPGVQLTADPLKCAGGGVKVIGGPSGLVFS